MVSTCRFVQRRWLLLCHQLVQAWSGCEPKPALTVWIRTSPLPARQRLTSLLLRRFLTEQFFWKALEIFDWKFKMGPQSLLHLHIPDSLRLGRSFSSVSVPWLYRCFMNMVQTTVCHPMLLFGLFRGWVGIEGRGMLGYLQIRRFHVQNWPRGFSLPFAAERRTISSATMKRASWSV